VVTPSRANSVSVHRAWATARSRRRR
jgi:hypothetical protein